MSSVDNSKGAQPDPSVVKASVVPSKTGGRTPDGFGMWNKLESTLTRMVSDTQPRQNESEYMSALRLVQKASEAIDVLQDRCRRLENDVRDTNERVKSEAASSERVIKDWEQLAGALKAQVSKSEADLAEALQKVKAAEERATAAEARAQTSENLVQLSDTRAHEAESRANAAEKLVAQEIELATSFRHTIIETFGSGSRLSAVLAGDPGHGR